VPYPIDTIKSELQTMTKKSTFTEVGKAILAKDGIKGLYRGVSVTMIRAMPGNATIFFVYEKVSKWITNH
jgi:mitochondrial ornithine carrier protein